MRAVRLRLAAELRSSWRSWLALALLIGLAGGVAVTAVAGARRTATAYPRLVAWSKASDLFTGGFGGKLDPEQVYATIEHLPSVAEWGRVDLLAYGVVLPSGKLITVPDIAPATDLQAKVGFAFDRFKVLSGRLFDLAAPDEGMVDFGTAQRFGLDVGSELRVVLGDPFAERPATTPVRIVGVVASPSAFPAFGTGNNLSLLALTPAFASAHHVNPDPSNSTILIRVRGGQAGIAAFLADMRRAGLGEVDIPYFQAIRTAGVQKSLRLEADALWALAAVVVLAAGAILGQSLARQTHQLSTEFPILRAVGMSGVQLFGLGVLRAAVVGGLAAATGVVLAFLLSPTAPIGLARLAEPDPGFAADVPVLMLGAGAILGLTVLIAAFPAWHAARIAARGRAAAAERPSVLANAVQRSSISPSAGVGVRMALEPGRGRTAVPVRSAILGATLAIATLVASVLFYSSVQHLLRTPRLSGFAWDAFAAADTAKDNASIEAALKADPDVSGWTRGGYTNLKIAGRSVFGIDTGGGGAASPVVVDGRAPAKDEEIALGAASTPSPCRLTTCKMRPRRSGCGWWARWSSRPRPSARPSPERAPSSRSTQPGVLARSPSGTRSTDCPSSCASAPRWTPKQPSSGSRPSSRRQRSSRRGSGQTSAPSAGSHRSLWRSRSSSG
jgi:hypothetical protein